MHFWKHMAADWKPAVLVALLMFAVAMWYGLSRSYEDIGLFAVAMGLGTLCGRDGSAYLSEDSGVPQQQRRPSCLTMRCSEPPPRFALDTL
jgi:hypothetical protein